MVANKPTNYLNSKGRRIFKGAQGGYFARAADGSKVYKPKAAFRKAGGEGAQVKITKTRNNTNKIPSPLRPKVTKVAVAKAKGGPRKRRANAGVARGVRSGTLQRRMNAEVARRRARALVARKRRSNAGVKRGVRSGTLARRQAAASARRRARALVGRKRRANAGVARGPREGALQRRMNAEAARRRARALVARKRRSNAGVKRGMRTPTEAALYQMIFGPEKKAIKSLKAMIVSPGGTTYRSKAGATRARKKRQGYSARNNESIGMRNRLTGGSATLLARRRESQGMRKASGNRPNAFVKARKKRSNTGKKRGPRSGMMLRSGRRTAVRR